MKGRFYKTPEKMKKAREILEEIGYDKADLDIMSDEDCDNELTEIFKAE